MEPHFGGGDFSSRSGGKASRRLRGTRLARQETGGTDDPAVVLTSNGLNPERDLNQLGRVSIASPMPRLTNTLGFHFVK